MSTMIQDSQELKALGNRSFQAGDFEDAVTYYTQAIDLSDNKNNKLVYFKNRAACYLKQVCIKMLIPRLCVVQFVILYFLE